MKVSFDFDSTLSRRDVQVFATDLVNRGLEVWIVTSRTDTQTALERGWHWIKNQNDILYEVAELCGILKERIHFTDHVDKVDFLEGKSFVFHLDDDIDELWEISKSFDSCKGICVDDSDWMDDCLEILGIDK